MVRDADGGNCRITHQHPVFESEQGITVINMVVLCETEKALTDHRYTDRKTENREETVVEF